MSQQTMSLDNRVAVITGGASGIGSATARRFVAEGARVVIADIQAGPGEALARNLGPACRFVRADVSAEDEVAAAVGTAVREFGRLDIMFSNAGVIGGTGSIARIRMSDVDATYAVNLRGPIIAMKCAAKVMLPQRSGVIILTSSPAALAGGLGAHAYSATKAGLLGVMRSVAAELRPHGIRVNAVIPGAVVSPMTAAAHASGPDDLDGAHSILAARKLGERVWLPEDVAAAVAFLAGDESRMMTSHALVIDSGLTQINGESPYTTGGNAEPGAQFEAGRRTGSAYHHATEET